MLPPSTETTTFFNAFDIDTRRRRTVQVLQLVEVTETEYKASLPSRPSTSSRVSSYSSSSSSEEDSNASEYCSSDEEEELARRFARNTCQDDVDVVDSDDEQAFMSRMEAIDKWRFNASLQPSTPTKASHVSPSTPRRRQIPFLKRKKVSGPRSVDSRCSKRSRSANHTCPACDVTFDSIEHLRRHGRGLRAHEACRAAVEYRFE